MSVTQRPFVRIYYEVVDDPRFEEIYTDDAAFATWVRLLMVADATYPANPPVPRSVASVPLERLVGAGIVDLLPGDRYRIHGLAKEREGRSSQAAEAGKKRAADARREGGRFTSDAPPDAGDDEPPFAGGAVVRPTTDRPPTVQPSSQPAKPEPASTSQPDLVSTVPLSPEVARARDRAHREQKPGLRRAFP